MQPLHQTIKKQAVLLSSHVFNDFIMSGYEKLREAIIEDMDLFLLIEMNENDFNIPVSINKFTFSLESLNGLNYIPIAETILPGSNHFPLFLFYREHPCYAYYWNIEYDVYCNGDWSALFDAFMPVDSDFLTSHIERYQQTTEWMWWDTLQLQTMDIPKAQYVKSFNPIYRISNKAMAFLDKVLSEGNFGHHEVLIPTVLNHAGYKINDWGGMGEFVLPGKENTVYTTNSNVSNYYYLGSSMRYRPLFYLEELESKIKDNLLYHPVKQRKMSNYMSPLVERHCEETST